MKRILILTTVIAILLSLSFLTYSARAQVEPAAGGYSLSWWTVDGGGGSSSGTGYSLSGTAGQPDAGSLTGTGCQLSGGFWIRPGSLLKNLFLPLVIR